MPTIPDDEIERIAATSKDPRTGRMVTQAHRIEGAAMIYTTAAGLDEELLQRCLVLTVAKEGR